MAKIAVLECGCSISARMITPNKVTRLYICPRHLCKLLGCKSLDEVADKWRKVVADDG